ncbi:P-loop containing nucleoside triphosphate hydrolase protein, partial [Pisolithus orientalis]|uniref:P-loop containing nucleoside triphosphate hydrolase protein n=1 Tax=Pisolithus orientalis TaxID=936130 RepID=UPI002224F6F5
LRVMGPTGSGKTNFINRLMGRGEDGAAHGLKSHTQAVREHIVNLSNNQQYVLVDTPGFDDTYRSDRDILKTIADWLERKYRNDVKLTGIIYTHRITDNRMSGSVCKNLDMFGGLCGDTAAERVRLVTTMWDKAKDKNIAENRVSQLETNFWKPLIDAGARHERFNNSSGSAWKIVRGLTGGGEAVLLQEELVDVEMKLNETTAGKALYLQFQRLLHEQKETIKQLQEEAKAQKDSELMKQLQAEQRRLEAQLQMMLGNVDELKIPFARRAALLFTKRTQALPVSV